MLVSRLIVYIYSTHDLNISTTRLSFQVWRNKATKQCTIPVVPNLITYVIMINVANFLIKAVIVLVKF